MKIDPQHLLPLGDGLVEQGDVADPGCRIGKENLQAAEFGDAARDHGFDIGFDCRIRRHREGAAAGGTDQVSGFLDPGRGAAGDQHLGTFLGEAQRAGPADATACAGDDYAFVL